MRKSLRAILGVTAATTLVITLGAPLAHADPVASMTTPIRQLFNPSNNLSLVTPWADEADAAKKQHGYTTDLGAPFKASATKASGLTAVHRLWNAKTVDFTEALAGSSAYQQALGAGYVDQGARFYALPEAVQGKTEPVYSYVKSGKHRLATAAVAGSLSGWARERVAFHVPAGTATAPQPDPTPAQPSAAGAGAVTVGAAAYPVPAGAIHVSPSGKDSAAGTAAAPVRTIQRGVNLAPAGGSVVVRGGVYRETVTTSKSVTIQNHPNEAVWLDGSSPVTGWVAEGSIWRKDGWTTRFDSSPTYTQGAPDSTTPMWQFVNPNTHPMAAHPDQVFVNGSPLQQVKSKSLVKAGTFYLDEGSSKLYIGTNPNGSTVEASTIVKAMNIRSADTVVRGIGIRRFSPSVFHMGSVTVEQPRVKFENVAVLDAATTGISILRENVTLNQVTVSGAGMLGIHGRFADNLTLNKVLSTKNNDEHFNIAPNAGGVKLGQTRGVTVSGSSFSGNYAHGFWEDMSVYNSVFRQSKFNDNAGTGLFLEISAKAVVGDNEFANNKEFGIKVNNTSDVKIWNNTFVGNGRPLNLVQDNRRNTNKSDPAVDFRVAFPDPAMPWTLGPVTVRNNVIAHPSGAANCMLCVEDYSLKNSAEQMKITANSNVYSRASASQPTWISIWSRANVNPNPHVFTSLSALQSATGQEKRGREFIGNSIVDSNRNLVTSVRNQQASIAEPLPGDVASAIGRPAGSTSLGRW